MPKDLSSVTGDQADLANRLGELPHAPLAMPHQVLEHPIGLLARLRPLWDGFVRTHVFGN
ncbi:MAG: hypothetical protein GC186_06975 [Rhodobacteraceae bacterium]|nr:hypothetical protein [Paracoccaceae bacterium]